MQIFPVLLQTVAIFIAAISVVIGVTAWRRSALGNRKLEIAEEAICVFRQLVDAIQEIRSPLSLGGEGSTRQRSDAETERESEIYDRAYIAFERANRHSELFSRVFALRHQVAFYFGDEIAEAFGEPLRVRHSIFISARALSRDWLRQGEQFRTPGQFDQHLERMHRHEAVFWEGSNEPDEINLALEAAYEQLESECKKMLNPKPTLKGHAKQMYNGMLAYLDFR